jgi:hypothetical protein
VTLVHSLEEGNLGVAGKINVLGAIGNQLHKTTRHLVLAKKIIWAREGAFACPNLFV